MQMTNSTPLSASDFTWWCYLGFHVIYFMWPKYPAFTTNPTLHQVRQTGNWWNLFKSCPSL